MDTPARDPVRRLISSATLAERLDLKRNTPRIWRQRGVGPRHISIGRLVRYDEAEVDRWLAERSTAR